MKQFGEKDLQLKGLRNGMHRKNMYRNGKKAVATMVCASMMLLGVGCGNHVENNRGTELTAPQQTAQETQKELQKITVGEVAHSIFYAPGYAAMTLGYFEEEGLDIDLVNLQGADKVMTALISGEIEVALAGPEEPYQLRKQ